MVRTLSQLAALAVLVPARIVVGLVSDALGGRSPVPASLRREIDEDCMERVRSVVG